MNSSIEKVVIVDFGSQVTQLIARRVREAGVYSQIVSWRNAAEEIIKLQPKAIILSGSPSSTSKSDAPRIANEIFTANVPILGICYGQQALCSQLGGKVESSDKREYGRADLKIVEDSLLFDGLWQKGSQYPVWMSHGDHVIDIPADFRVIATSHGSPYAAIENTEKSIYAVQFHPEVSHTPDGHKLIQNFLYRICGFEKKWNMRSYLGKAIADIRAQVGDAKVICGLSGGVDSSVAAILINKAIGKQLTCIFVDHGLLRHNEAQQVVDLFKKHYDIPLHHIDASELFLRELKGVQDPEAKRKIIGRLFVEIFEAEAKKIGGAEFLAQGTLYPDIIESCSLNAEKVETIKSHHNVGGLPEKMNMKLLEPLRELFKDEVRQLGFELGLSEDFIKRHPFPGPGLAIRCLGEISKEKLNILRQADRIYLEEIKQAGLYDDIWQAFAVLLPVKTVGVMGDARTYEHVCALRAVNSIDGMTADFFRYNMDFLAKISSRICNEVKGINRVVYDITSKPPGTIEWE